MGFSGCLVIHENDSAATPIAAIPVSNRAGPRLAAGMRATSVLPTALATSIGPTMCEPQRSCSLVTSIASVSCS